MSVLLRTATISMDALGPDDGSHEAVAGAPHPHPGSRLRIFSEKARWQDSNNHRRPAVSCPLHQILYALRAPRLAVIPGVPKKSWPLTFPANLTGIIRSGDSETAALLGDRPPLWPISMVGGAES